MRVTNLSVNTNSGARHPPDSGVMEHGICWLCGETLGCPPADYLPRFDRWDILRARTQAPHSMFLVYAVCTYLEQELWRLRRAWMD